MYQLPSSNESQTIDPAGSYESYSDFIQAIINLKKKYPNAPASTVGVQVIMAYPAYMDLKAWEIKRMEWALVERIRDEMD